jgi:hypothetical protein
MIGSSQTQHRSGVSRIRDNGSREMEMNGTAIRCSNVIYKQNPKSNLVCPLGIRSDSKNASKGKASDTAMAVEECNLTAALRSIALQRCVAHHSDHVSIRDIKARLVCGRQREAGVSSQSHVKLVKCNILRVGVGPARDNAARIIDGGRRRGALERTVVAVVLHNACRERLHWVAPSKLPATEAKKFWMSMGSASDGWHRRKSRTIWARPASVATMLWSSCVAVAIFAMHCEPWH